MMQTENHVFAGLQLDISVSKQLSQYLIDAHNIRITAREGETLLSVTNELGPKELKLVNSYGDAASIFGTIIGHCTINEYLVLFTTGKTENYDPLDLIYRIDMSKEDPEVFVLYRGEGPESLNFSVDHPIETLSDYENENILKVYWTDGINLPRVINIKTNSPYTWNGAFDFVPSLKLAEEINITRDTNASGMFAPGVIQYAFTYYNKYGQESNIFYVSPLNYISHYDRGGSPEDVISVAFKIKVESFDTNFDYLRIYSIHRTSHDAIPTCKRVLDISIKDNLRDGMVSVITYLDTGTSGDIIDPASLLYKGGEEIVASSIAAKDGTLFLGNISFLRPSIQNIVVENNITFKNHVRIEGNNRAYTGSLEIYLPQSSTGPYKYSNGLASYSAGFKNNEYYRLGILALYKNGKWSEPVFIEDYKVSSLDVNNLAPKIESNNNLNKDILYKLIIKGVLSDKLVNALYDAGYKKIRPVVVFPEILDRSVLLQGVGCPTLYTQSNREDLNNYALSSWFFRPQIPVKNEMEYYQSDYIQTNGGVPYGKHNESIPYTNNSLEWYPGILRAVEILGHFEDKNKFHVDWNTFTLHSPDIVFDTAVWNRSLAGLKCRIVGLALFENTISDITVLTSSPTINGKCAGFTRKPSFRDMAKGIISGLYYEDYVVDDNGNNEFGTYPYLWSAFRWMVYPWHKNGSLNNDINRSVSSGLRTANLSKKVISNLRYSNTVWRPLSDRTSLTIDKNTIPLLFSSNEVSIVKLGDHIYKGNIDTLLSPDEEEGLYFAFGDVKEYTTENGDTYTSGPSSITVKDINTSFGSKAIWKTWAVEGLNGDTTVEKVILSGLYRGIKGGTKYWEFRLNNKYISDIYSDLAVNKEPVRMKYKSTPHIVIKLDNKEDNLHDLEDLIDYSLSAYCVLPIIELYRDYDPKTTFGGLSPDAIKANKWLPAGEPVLLNYGKECEYNYTYGDTWFARYDCLKTYPFTFEDTNLIVEIGSFMLETRINIDGRYDRNRGLIDNTTMSPINFNLFNPVYSQRDNFFTYRILDDDFYKLNEFPNLITWSTLKMPGLDVDPWTTVTLAATFSMDGSKGQIRSINTWGDTLYCFLDNEVSVILFNSRVQIPTSDGVPIEISNNYKVDGKRTVLEGAGCANKFAICPTPTGLYFIDSVGGHFQAIGGNGLNDLSLSKGMVTWLSKLKTTLWKPNEYTTKVFYDRNNKDIYIVTDKEALCYNEAIGEFISYMSYENIPVMFNVVDKFYCVKNNYISQMFAGEYNYFFDEYKGYDITFVSNGKTSSGDMSTIDKIYTNIEFRADKWSDKLNSILSLESPFDYIRVWNEYLDTGEVLLLDKPNKPSPLKKKFRVWRILIPRDAHNRRDRIRNTWCKIKLGASPKYNSGNNSFILLHDAAVQFVV